MKKYTCCGNSESNMNYRWHTFANQTMHISCHCPTCNRFIAHIPQGKPYTDWVKGSYVSPSKTKPVIDNSEAVSLLKAIVNLPDIEKYIGTILFNKAKKIV